jgi:NAD(P)-dependent dehydrogenase (short-subunit alcohol dehydrogenase family)
MKTTPGIVAMRTTSSSWARVISATIVSSRSGVHGSGHKHETAWFRDIYLRHGRIPLRRPAQPEDIARAAAFFCGDDCIYVTGQVLSVDGGLSATF